MGKNITEGIKDSTSTAFFNNISGVDSNSTILNMIRRMFPTASREYNYNNPTNEIPYSDERFATTKNILHNTASLFVDDVATVGSIELLGGFAVKTGLISQSGKIAISNLVKAGLLAGAAELYAFTLPLRGATEITNRKYDAYSTQINDYNDSANEGENDLVKDTNIWTTLNGLAYANPIEMENLIGYLTGSGYGISESEALYYASGLGGEGHMFTKEELEALKYITDLDYYDVQIQALLEAAERAQNDTEDPSTPVPYSPMDYDPPESQQGSGVSEGYTPKNFRDADNASVSPPAPTHYTPIDYAPPTPPPASSGSHYSPIDYGSSNNKVVSNPPTTPTSHYSPGASGANQNKTLPIPPKYAKLLRQHEVEKAKADRMQQHGKTIMDNPEVRKFYQQPSTPTKKVSVSVRPKTSWTYIDYLTTKVDEKIAKSI